MDCSFSCTCARVSCRSPLSAFLMASYHKRKWPHYLFASPPSPSRFISRLLSGNLRMSRWLQMVIKQCSQISLPLFKVLFPCFTTTLFVMLHHLVDIACTEVMCWIWGEGLPVVRSLSSNIFYILHSPRCLLIHAATKTREIALLCIHENLPRNSLILVSGG